MLRVNRSVQSDNRDTFYVKSGEEILYYNFIEKSVENFISIIIIFYYYISTARLNPKSR